MSRKGILGFIDTYTPWNTGYESEQKAKNAAEAAKLQAEIDDQAAENKLLQTVENNKLYVVIGIGVVLMIILVAFFKFRK